MSPTRAEQKKLDEVLHVLSRLKGVRNAFYLTGEVRRGLGRIERQYPPIGPLTVRNDGVLECLKRQHVACIIKDRSFRSPPHATVLLVNEDGEVIGRELLRGEKVDARKEGRTIFLGDDFVIFVDKGSGKGARFVLPPVAFGEVEAIEGTSRVISSSPSAMGDLYLRRSVGLEDDPKLASILIGFDLR